MTHQNLPDASSTSVSAAAAVAAPVPPVSTDPTPLKKRKVIAVRGEPLVDLSMICSDDTCRELIEQDDLLTCIAPGCGQNVSSR